MMVVGVMLLPLTVHAQNSENMSLPNVVRMSIATHPTVDASKANAREAEFNVRDQRSDFFPTVSTRTSGGLDRANNTTTRGRASRPPDGGDPARTQGRYQVELTVNQRVFDAGDTLYRSRSASLAHQSTLDLVADSEEIIGLRAIAAYLDVVRQQRIVEFAEENVARHVEVLELIQERAEGGGGSEADVAQTRTRLSQARSNLVQAQGDLQIATADFIEAVGLPPSGLERPESVEKFLPKDLDEALGDAALNNHALKSSNNLARSAEFDRQAATSSFLPRLDIELSHSRENNVEGVDGQANESAALLVLSYDIFAGGRDLAQLNEAREAKSEAEFIAAETQRLVEEQVRVNFANLRTSEERVRILIDRVETAGEVVDAYAIQFELGQRTLLDVLDVENELFEAQVALEDAETLFLVSQYQVLATVGRLIRAVDLADAEAS